MPIALADVVALLVAVVRVNSANPDEIRVPSRAETLKSWPLPFLAEAIEADEEEQRAFALLDSIRNLGKKHEQ